MEMLNLTKDTPMLNLSKDAPNFVTIKGILNWDMHPVHAASLSEGFDLDIFAVVFDQNEKISGGQDVVFFNNKTYTNGSISIPVDNRTGEGDDDEFIDLKLNSIPTDKRGVDVYVILRRGQHRGQNFSMITNAKFELFDVDNGNKLIQSYSLIQYTNETAIHIGRFERSGSGWSFQSAGEGAIADGYVGIPKEFCKQVCNC